MNTDDDFTDEDMNSTSDFNSFGSECSFCSKDNTNLENQSFQSELGYFSCSSSNNPQSWVKKRDACTNAPKGYLIIWKDQTWCKVLAIVVDTYLRCYESCQQKYPSYSYDLSYSKVMVTDLGNMKGIIVVELISGYSLYVQVPEYTKLTFWFEIFVSISTESLIRSRNRKKVMCHFKKVKQTAKRTFGTIGRKADDFVSFVMRQPIESTKNKRFHMRGFLYVSFDGNIFSNRYCTLDIDGCLSIYKYRRKLSGNSVIMQIYLPNFTLIFPNERLNCIQFNIFDKILKRTILIIRGQDVFMMGRVLNILSKHIEISDQNATKSKDENNSLLITQTSIKPAENAIMSPIIPAKKIKDIETAVKNLWLDKTCSSAHSSSGLSSSNLRYDVLSDCRHSSSSNVKQNLQNKPLHEHAREDIFLAELKQRLENRKTDSADFPSNGCIL